MAHQDEDIRSAARAPYGPLSTAPHPQQIGDKAFFVDPEAGQALYQVQSGNYVKIAGSAAPGASVATTSAPGTVAVDNNMAGAPVAVTTASRGAASGVCDLDAARHVPLSRLSGLTTTQLDAAAGILAAQIASVNPAVLTGAGTVPSAALPAATTSTLGAVKAGAGLTVDGSGLLSAAWVKLAEVAVGSAQPSLDFTAIVGLYRHLWLLVLAAADTPATHVHVHCRLNGDSAAHYDYEECYAYSTAVGASEGLADDHFLVGDIVAASGPAGAADYIELLIVGYAQSSLHKALRIAQSTKSGTTSGTLITDAKAGWWRNTAPVTSVSLFPASGNFAVGSLATLYGLP